ncbi:MAG: glycosyltransferase family 2 protein [Caldilineaceae bacterium]|nr:glycosyltransferase family 2 protein [Caldilineaceae bacterium]
MESNLPLVSCLCVTENRAAFMPWLLWGYDRQRWPRRELVIVDSSTTPFAVDGRDDIRVISAPAGMGVAAKRNWALREARGELIAWFDDDDWQHPDRLALLVEALGVGAICAGTRQGWFVDLESRCAAPYRGFQGRIVFNSALFHRAAVTGIPFPESVKSASDTPWMAAVMARYPAGAVTLPRQDLFFWLCHDENLSNPARRRAFPEPLSRFVDRCGVEAWGDTDEALDALKSRLHKTAHSAPIPAQVARRIEPQTPPDEPTGDLPIGVMIKATVLDAPYLETMARHMIAQARYPFGERVIVVDRTLNFGGKYRNRPRLSMDALDAILDRLLAEDVINAVRDVDPSSACVHAVMERYFGAQGRQTPTHAATGGPIYATLFGLESMGNDYVLQMDADIFFHRGEASWVRQAAALLHRDPRLWLMMTHPGPPAGPPGQSLSGRNARTAVWDAHRRLWRFRHATTRYFLCDRRRLHGRLRPIAQMGGVAPLEQMISAAMARHGAFRGALGDLESWHLHAWHHGEPFPQWAPALTQLIEDGRFPEFQRGEYDLRLDQPIPRREWGKLVAGSQSASIERARPRPVEERRTQPTIVTPILDVRQNSVAPIAVVIPIRNRAGQRLRNTLAGLRWQSAGIPAQILVVSHGSRPEIDSELRAICAENCATLIPIGAPSEPWNKPLALNAGIRASAADLPFVMTMDADMILAPNFLEVVLRRLQQSPPALALCRISDLPQDAHLPTDPAELRRAFEHLRRRTHLRRQTGSGGIQAAARSFFFEIRGYDEDLLWWGAMDGDMLIRARAMKLEHAWLEEQTAMLHQWHPRKHAVLSDPREIAQARRHWQINHDLIQRRSRQPVRNSQAWGRVKSEE